MTLLITFDARRWRQPIIWKSSRPTIIFGWSIDICIYSHCCRRVKTRKLMTTIALNDFPITCPCTNFEFRSVTPGELGCWHEFQHGFPFQIDKWMDTFEEFDKLESHHVLEKWLMINLMSFKQFMLNECCKWGNVYKDYLLDYVQLNLNVRFFIECSPSPCVIDPILQNLDELIDSSTRILLTEFAWDDLDTLLKVMFVLNEIKEKDSEVQGLFEPLKRVVDLLLMYGVTVPERCSIQVIRKCVGGKEKLRFRFHSLLQ